MLRGTGGVERGGCGLGEEGGGRLVGGEMV